MLIAVLITIGNLNDVKGEEIKSEKYIFNDNCLEQVIINNNVVVKINIMKVDIEYGSRGKKLVHLYIMSKIYWLKK